MLQSLVLLLYLPLVVAVCALPAVSSLLARLGLRYGLNRRERRQLLVSEGRVVKLALGA